MSFCNNNGRARAISICAALSTGFAGNQSSAAVGGFPNVAVYLDDQSMQFPARNVDIYMVDMDRVEVLEGPQGTLFGGGAEAGALRYITAKPKLGVFEGSAEGSYSFTAGGDPNKCRVNAMINIPIIKDVFAVRASVFTRSSRRLHRQRSRHHLRIVGQQPDREQRLPWWAPTRIRSPTPALRLSGAACSSTTTGTCSSSRTIRTWRPTVTSTQYPAKS